MWECLSLLCSLIIPAANAVVVTHGVDAVPCVAGLPTGTLVHIYALMLVEAALVTLFTLTAVTAYCVHADMVAAAIVDSTLVNVFTVCSIQGFVVLRSAPTLGSMAAGVATESITIYTSGSLLSDPVALLTYTIVALELSRNTPVVAHIRADNVGN